jgi:hemerythrin-like domain-containing protein
MKATEILMQEHDVIIRVLAALETETAKARAGKSTPEFFLDAADFIKGFADGCHHAKEEGVLFKYMEAAGIPAQNGPIAVMLADHEQGRLFTRQMRAAALRWQTGDAAAVGEVVENASGYIQLLRGHIFKENNILFPMADRAIPAGKHAEIDEAFEHVEHEETGAGVHEKYLALAEKLEAQAIN